MDWDVKSAVVDAARAMYREGLVIGLAGNVSARSEGRDAMHITPTRVPYPELMPDDIVTVTFEGDPVEGEGLPSSESLMHGAVYAARPDARAVVHAHPVHASAMAVRHEAIPAFVDEQVLYLGGAVEVSLYAPAASEALAQNAVAALGERRAVLLANHGTLAVGRDPADALEITRLTERLAQIWLLASARAGAQRLPRGIVEAETELYRMLQNEGGV
ncbi:MAG: class II aldolase/adducin family protein [Chloroflexi bacterium]|nr:class II aldolase/adducin family protein [Chloroflexota bacterium]MCY3957726.1 class II aldolase/adducin family protein [Chloroflexota bacterium]